ncbi:hypothetical protein B1R66_09780 [Salmonella enterica subsp. enterica serovar Weltevreden]|nr:hypothetical protein [Salmonella enterica subsp. enterica serovar Weltevreden]PRV08575.1 hypothetical protein B1R66_09780 [Salmonella enterica subsp. enterica serovar Weltevreden]
MDKTVFIFIGAVFPAPAGINRGLCPQETMMTSVPRASGDKPAKTALENSINMCSPCQRG